MMVLDTTQMVRQRLTARATRRCLGLGWRLGHRRLQRGELRFEVGFVLRKRSIDDALAKRV
jgi:hypothetical protein